MPEEEMGKTPQDQFMDVVEKVQTDLPDDPYQKMAFFVLHRDSFPRKQCIAVLDNPWFDRFILVLIVLNCLTMMLFEDPIVSAMYGTNLKDTNRAILVSKRAANNAFRGIQVPLDATCTLGKWPPCSVIDHIDVFFLICFTVEFLIKLVGLGFLMYKNAYLRSGWNVLDAVVVITGWVTLLSPSGVNISALRSFKVLRPLRSMNKIRGMRVLVQSIMSAVPQLCNVVGFLFFYLIVFGIIGVTLFQSTMRHSCWADDGEGGFENTGWICNPFCEYDPKTTRAIPGSCQSLGPSTKQQKYDPFGYGSGFRNGPYTCRPNEQCLCGDEGPDSDDPENCKLTDNPNYGVNNFDNIFWASVTIFQSITLEGWVDIMYQVMDGSGLMSCWFFIVAVIMGAYIVINLFLAVLCDNFNMADSDGPEEEKVDGEQLVARAAAKLKHNNPLRRVCLQLTLSKKFNNLVVVVILINTLVMMFATMPEYPNVNPDYREYDYAPPELYWFFMVSNWVLSAFFVFESFVKVVGLGPTIFKKDFANVFDLVVVACSLVEISIDILTLAGALGGGSFGGVSALRAFRLLRLLKLVRFVASLRAILTTLISSMQSVVYLALLLVLFIVIFSLIGMQFFGGLYDRPQYQYTREFFPELFESRGVVWDQMGDPAPDLTFDSFGDAFLTIFVILSGENWNDIYFNHHRASYDIWDVFATFYFLTLFIFGNLLLFNLFIAILLSNFDDSDEEEGDKEEEDDDLKDGDSMKPPKPAAAAAQEPSLMEYAFGSYRGVNEADKRKSGGLGLKRNEAAGGDALGNGEEADEPAIENPNPTKLPPKDDPSGDKSLCLFSWANPLRRFLATVVWHPYFEDRKSVV